MRDRPHPTPAPDERLARPVLARVAKDLSPRLPALTEELLSELVDRFPELHDPDAAIGHYERSSIQGNLRNIFAMFESGIEGDSLGPPPEALELAGHCAYLPTMTGDLLMRIYHSGEKIIWTHWVFPMLAEEASSVEELTASASLALGHLSAYLERAAADVVREFQQRRDEFSRDTYARQAASVSELVAGHQPDEDALGGIPYDFAGTHVAFVCWSDPAASAASAALLSVGNEIGSAVPRGRRLLVLPEAREAWGWFQPAAGARARETGLLRLLHSRDLAVHVAIGESAAGLDGFRRSHRDARRVRDMVSAAHRPPPSVTTYESVALATLLVADREAAGDYCRRRLGPLAGNTAEMRGLRETVHTFLQTRASYTRTAERLHLHRNTVLYRVHKVEKLLGKRLPELDDQLRSALLIAEWLDLDTSG